ncbi:MAG: hypothetical protein IIB60_04095, partial [Planctomycetes bacterium]|nr:hypothetical protein [Planctomycetota bacterium]
MKRVLTAVLGLCIGGASALGATVLNVSVETSGGSNSTTVGAGGSVDYQIVGELGAGVADNNGLALVGFDLELVGTPDAGPLPAADAPSSGSMTAFVKPDGITNPDGYGGTLIGNVRTQVGGGQNTINNVFACSIDSDCPGDTNTCDGGFCSQSASFPVGAVETGIAWPGSPQILVTGSLTIPAGAPDGTVYTLVLSNLFANVILAGENGTGLHGFHKATNVLDGGANTPLTITVESGTCEMSGSLNCEIDARKPHDLLNAAQCNGAAGVCGWQTMTLTFVCSGTATPPTQVADYSISSGTAVIDIVDVVVNTATVTFVNPMA